MKYPIRKQLRLWLRDLKVWWRLRKKAKAAQELTPKQQKLRGMLERLTASDKVKSKDVMEMMGHKQRKVHGLVKGMAMGRIKGNVKMGRDTLTKERALEISLGIPQKKPGQLRKVKP